MISSSVDIYLSTCLGQEDLTKFCSDNYNREMDQHSVTTDCETFVSYVTSEEISIISLEKSSYARTSKESF